MKQQDLGLKLSTRRTRKAVLLNAMTSAIPCTQLVALIAAHAAVVKTQLPPFGIEMMLRIHCLRQWFVLSDLAAEEAIFEMSIYRDFARLSGTDRIPDRVSILRFLHLLEEHVLSPHVLQSINDKLSHHGLMLKAGTGQWQSDRDGIQGVFSCHWHGYWQEKQRSRTPKPG